VRVHRLLTEAAQTWASVGREVYAVAFSPDVHSLASGGVEGVRLWSLYGAGRPYQAEHLTGHDGAVKSVAFAPDGSTLLSGSQDGTARLWDLATDTLAAHSSSVYGVAVAPPGRRAGVGQL
jgi:WD40 repeat protein